jgi:hypothetical protein
MADLAATPEPEPYSKIDETQETATAFWLRAVAFFAAHGIVVKAVLTDKWVLLPFPRFAAALGMAHQSPQGPPVPAPDQRQGRTLQPNLTAEWAYARLRFRSRSPATYQSSLQHDNHHMTHIGIGGKIHISPVHNVGEITTSGHARPHLIACCGASRARYRRHVVDQTRAGSEIGAVDPREPQSLSLFFGAQERATSSLRSCPIPGRPFG